MNSSIYVRVDADCVGDDIELCLIRGAVANAQEIHRSVQKSLELIVDHLRVMDHCKVLMVGADDVLFEVESAYFTIDQVESVRRLFVTGCNYTLSAGVGDSIYAAVSNLKLAKLSGRNRIVKFSELVNYT